MASTNILVSILRLKNLNAQLTDSEFDKFISKLWKSIGREEMMTRLCTQYLSHRGETMEPDDALTKMTKITSDVIRDRDSKSNLCTIPKLHDMPSALIGGIASYLYQEEYIEFAMTNRKVYVDCNTPNRLQQLALLDIDYRIVPLSQFSQLKELCFDLKRISEFKEINGRRFGDCNQLQTLAIYGQYSTISDINVLINDSSRCFSSIRSLTLSEFPTFDPAMFVSLLSKFNKLQHLKLITSINLQGQWNIPRLTSLCPNARELASFGRHDEQMLPVFDAWRSRIHTLSVHSLPNDRDLSLVKRLCIVAAQPQPLESLLKRSQSLREMAWVPNCNTPPEPPFTAFTSRQIEDITKQCIIDRPELEYFFISTRGYFDAFCNGLQRGLYLTKKRKKEQMEIALNVDVREISNADEFMCSISRIIQAVGMSDIKEWIFCVEATAYKMEPQFFAWSEIKVALDDLLQSLQVKVTLLKGTEEGFMVGNTFKMKRHDKWWQRGRACDYY